MVVHQRPVLAKDKDAVVIEATLGAVASALCKLYADDLSSVRVQCPALKHEPEAGPDAPSGVAPPANETGTAGSSTIT